MAIMCAERRFVYMWGVNSYLMEASSQVKFGEEGGSMKLVQHVVNCGNEKPVLHCDFIESSVVCAKSPGSIFFFFFTNSTGEERDWCLALSTLNSAYHLLASQFLPSENGRIGRVSH